ncbi:MAG: 30S ribosomal protein S17 [Candidatus Brocadia sp. AMX2]|uniref:Small ribosomal subunit protein uS17 n=1 Tax=Candidatus Brocadia sinica JPN1 TaxID=1197129 RepID=A0ABQ0JYA5_9BACT|nr:MULTISPECIES: 30S ribosomal protein S17 [Brocadia]MBC6932927.1 30S ribosomal protein S17 [Candidatus Brocadia sp.]MBL1167587.1 30S ribosomal protein S17 [Candidatus Brocadia sp. AMX1]MCK6467580.1 30S ribosomal protein S17 [Candidatus Brocadia sinica]NOG40523.1 30S ribosomal protein S17 [Planctomycetota bacterium]MCE7867157.1 30S ribosomal protein S17 [Candidatus Brocadia sp. AMX2]
MKLGDTRGRRKKIVGMVVGNKMHKTIVVEVERLIKHTKYGKYIKRSTVYKAHDENNQAGIGDRVEIIETRPLSKTKTTKLLRVIEKAKQ